MAAEAWSQYPGDLLDKPGGIYWIARLAKYRAMVDRKQDRATAAALAALQR